MALVPNNFRDASSLFVQQNNSAQKRPVYYVTFGLVTGPLGINSQVFPDEYTTGPIQGATKTRKRYMSAPTSAPNTINPLTGVSSLSSITFDLLDINGEITTAVSSYTMKNRLVTIYKGYEGLDEQYYSSIYSGQINNWQLKQDGTAYTFSVTDSLKQLNTEILKGHTQLTQDFNPTDTTCFVTSSFYFASSTDLGDGNGPRNYLKINDCLYSYTGKGSGIVLDNTVTWQLIGQGTITATTPQWIKNTAYVVGNKVYNLGNVYRCVIAGTSAASGGPTGLGSSNGAFYGLQQIVLSSNGQSQPQINQAGSAVDNYVLFSGNPVDIMLQIILSTGIGTNHSSTGTNYDVLPANQGIGVPYSFVNITNFENQKNRFISWLTFSNYFMEQKTALKFFQDEIYKQAQLYLFTNKSGQLDLKVIYYPLPTNDYITLDDSNIIGIPQFNASLQTGNNFLNEVDINYDYQPVADFYVNQLITINNTSQQKYEEAAVDNIDAKFVNTRDKGFAIVNRITNIRMKRFSNPLPIIQVRCFAQLQLVNPGDTILLASSVLPNLLTGQRGGTVLCECLASAPDFQNDQVTLTLFATGYASNKRYAVIGTSGLPNYLQATTTQRNYAFLSTLVTGTSSLGFMSNGENGYYIGG